MKTDLVKEFLSAYFHEDWCVDAATDAEVIESFLSSGQTVGEIEELAAQLESVAREHRANHDGDWLFTKYGCYYSPDGDGPVATQWLFHIAHLLRRGRSPRSSPMPT